MGLLNFQFGGVIGLLLLGLWIWALVGVLRTRSDTATKVLWILFIAVLPPVGPIVWLLFGPRRRRWRRA